MKREKEEKIYEKNIKQTKRHDKQHINTNSAPLTGNNEIVTYGQSNSRSQNENIKTNK